MKKIAIYGSSSMAGHVLYEYFSLKDDYIIDCIEENKIFDEKIFLKFCLYDVIMTPFFLKNA